jgi:gas vesicle protein
MSRDQDSNKLAYFLIGAGVGAVVALLFAPKTGRELREDIADRTRRGVDKASEAYQTTRERARDLAATGREKAAGAIEHAKEAVAEQRSRLSAAVDAGKQAYREEKQKLVEVEES